MNQFLGGDFVYSSNFHQYIWQNKTWHFVFSVKGSFLIAKHSKCILSFMGVSDFKIFMFENSENKAQMNEKVSTLHKSRYLYNAPTDFSVKLHAVKVIILFDIYASFRLRNRNWCQIRRLNLGQVSVVIRFLRTRILFCLSRSVSLLFTCFEYLS